MKPVTLQKTDPHADRMAISNLMPPEFTQISKNRLQAMVETQNEVLGALEEMNREWFARVRTETNLACELAAKLAAVRSLPDTLGICQHWLSRRAMLVSEDGQRFFADAQKVAQATARLLSNGWAQGNGSGRSASRRG